jgi:hypothetical protein
LLCRTSTVQRACDHRTINAHGLARNGLLGIVE